MNRTKIYYGLLKEPDIQLSVVEEEEDGDAGDGAEKPKKKKPKKDHLLNKKAKSDPNAPPTNRLPLPDLSVLLGFISFILLDECLGFDG